MQAREGPRRDRVVAARRREDSLLLLLPLEAGKLTIEEFEELCTEVSRRTLQRDLKALIDAGLLEARGETDIRHYIAGKSVM
ncbi:MAG: hypothetical protein RRA92_11435 [Gemmatimonadota bacterium]|nr:hypothetical protein [Gemmatimonadota bacterium]